MLVAEIMTSPAVTVRDDMSVDLAIRVLAGQGLTLLPVVDADGCLVGVLSEVDLLGLPGLPDPRAHLRLVSHAGRRMSASVAELMTTSPRTTSDRADVADVAALFRGTSWKCLPVMHEDRLVGVVSRSDIIRAMARDDEDIEDDINHVLADVDRRWLATVKHGTAIIAGTATDRETEVAASLAASQLSGRDTDSISSSGSGVDQL